jgi:uncharacterized protein YdhG (YjbR/CyaY superfamily)
MPTTSQGERDVNAYLAAVPEPQQSTLRALRATLKELLPDGEECMSYGVPAIKLKGKAIAGYATAKNHCSYFPHSGQVIEELSEALSGYECGKGTLRFPINKTLPKSLVKRLVKARSTQLGF